jgi:retron-type reverse transcriptase
MKRVGYLWEGLVHYDNLLAAALKARRGKRRHPEVALFELEREHELMRLQTDLMNGTYWPSGYRTFTIRDKKPRLISAAPYRDRVLHHALCNVLEPVWEPRFDPDSYACRKGKGTHQAMRRAQALARQNAWAWKADVRKFFPSVDHAVLKGLLARKVKDRRVLALAERIIDGANAQEPVLAWYAGDDLFTPVERRRGLPIGNQTSQFFGNVYLDPLDHAVRAVPGVRGYVRYCDDFIVFAPEKRTVQTARARVIEVLAGLRLRLHPDKDTLSETRHGLRFVGYRVFPQRVLVPRESVRRFRRRLRRLRNRYDRQEIGLAEFQCRSAGWLGHAAQADPSPLWGRLLAEQGAHRMRAS